MIATERGNAVRFGAAFLVVALWAQIPRKEASEVTEVEYEVFSTYIGHSFIGKVAQERIDRSVSQIVLVNMTEFDQNEIEEDLSWKNIERYLRRKVPSLNGVTIDSFREANLRQAQLGFHFHLPLHYELVSSDNIGSIFHDVSEWPDYYLRYPGSQGFLALSRVGFSPDAKQAIFYASNRCGRRCATGSSVVMEKQGSAWTLVKEVIMWVS